MLLNNLTLYTDDQHALYTAYHPSHANTSAPDERRSTLELVGQLDCCLFCFYGRNISLLSSLLVLK